MPIYLTYFIQILLVIHVLKTGRNRYWIYLLLFVPMVGGVAYLIIEILPEFRGSIEGQRAMRNVKKAISPDAELQQLAAAWDNSPNADNARHYVKCLIDAGQFSQAEEILSQALAGFFSTEPNLLLLKARCSFERGADDQAIKTLESLQEANPEFRSAEGHLLHARALESANRMDEALDAYKAVAAYFPGVEARYRLALALKTAGQNEEARHEFDQLIKDAGLAPEHFRKAQKKWLAKAREQLKQMQS